MLLTKYPGRQTAVDPLLPPAHFHKTVMSLAWSVSLNSTRVAQLIVKTTSNYITDYTLFQYHLTIFLSLVDRFARFLKLKLFLRDTPTSRTVGSLYKKRRGEVESSPRFAVMAYYAAFLVRSPLAPTDNS